MQPTLWLPDHFFLPPWPLREHYVTGGPPSLTYPGGLRERGVRGREREEGEEGEGERERRGRGREREEGEEGEEGERERRERGREREEGEEEET